MKRVQEAKELLKKRGIKAIKPLQLAKASEQMGKSLLETLAIIAFLQSGGQGQGPFPFTERAIKGKHA